MRLLHAILVSATLASDALGQSATTVEAWYDNERQLHENEQAEREVMENAGRGAIDKAISLTTLGVGVAVSANELAGSWNALDSTDATCSSAYNDSAVPTVPSSCAESSLCESCYSEAVRHIDFNRFYIERARCITATHVKMATSAKAFGDSASGIHGVAGLAWQLEGKPQIKQAVEQLQNTYRRKAGEYLSGLESSLRMLGECEAEHFGERDWYQRYGWIYLNFMKNKYGTAPE